MKVGPCVKCGSEDIRLNRTRYSTRNFLLSGFITRKPIQLDNIVCASCGYVESYVLPEHLPTVARDLPPVAASTPPKAPEPEIA